MRWCFIFSWESASHVSPVLLFWLIFFTVKLVLNAWSTGEEILFAALSAFFFFLNDRLLNFSLLQCFPIWYKWELSVCLGFLHDLRCWSTRTVLDAFGLPALQDVGEVPLIPFYRIDVCSRTDFPGQCLPSDFSFWLTIYNTQERRRNFKVAHAFLLVFVFCFVILSERVSCVVVLVNSKPIAHLG